MQKDPGRREEECDAVRRSKATTGNKRVDDEKRHKRRRRSKDCNISNCLHSKKQLYFLENPTADAIKACQQPERQWQSSLDRLAALDHETRLFDCEKEYDVHTEAYDLSEIDYIQLLADRAKSQQLPRHCRRLTIFLCAPVSHFGAEPQDAKWGCGKSSSLSYNVL